LNIPAKFGIIITTIENFECKIKQLKARNQRLITIYHLPFTSYHLPVTIYQLPVTNYQLPITNNQLTLTKRRTASLKPPRGKDFGPASPSFEHLNFGN
jgi:hypothetical protein